MKVDTKLQILKLIERKHAVHWLKLSCEDQKVNCKTTTNPECCKFGEAAIMEPDSNLIRSDHPTLPDPAKSTGRLIRIRCFDRNSIALAIHRLSLTGSGLIYSAVYMTDQGSAENRLIV